MRPGGQEMDNIETKSPARSSSCRTAGSAASLDEWRPVLDCVLAEESDRIVQVLRKSPRAPRSRNRECEAKSAAPALTWSKDLKADFDPKTAQLAHLEQWNDFRYEEGTRKAKATAPCWNRPTI